MACGWLERYIQACLHACRKVALESIALGLELWSIPVPFPPSPNTHRGFCHLIRWKSWFCHANILAFASDEPELIRVSCCNQELPPSTPKCSGLKNLIALSNKHLYQGDRSRLTGQLCYMKWFRDPGSFHLGALSSPRVLPCRVRPELWDLHFLTCRKGKEGNSVHVGWLLSWSRSFRLSFKLDELGCLAGDSLGVEHIPCAPIPLAHPG